MTHRKLAPIGIGIALFVGAVAAYGALPGRSVDPMTVGLGNLAGETSVEVRSVSAFTRTFNQTHGTNAVLQHLRFTPGQSTGWITSPGPKIILVVGGELTATDDRCAATTYGDGQGFATDLDVHKGDAGENGAELYVLHLPPATADVLRVPADPPRCAQ